MRTTAVGAGAGGAGGADVEMASGAQLARHQPHLYTVAVAAVDMASGAHLPRHLPHLYTVAIAAVAAVAAVLMASGPHLPRHLPRSLRNPWMLSARTSQQASGLRVLIR